MQRVRAWEEKMQDPQFIHGEKIGTLILRTTIISMTRTASFNQINSMEAALREHTARLQEKMDEVEAWEGACVTQAGGRLGER